MKTHPAAVALHREVHDLLAAPGALVRWRPWDPSEHIAVLTIGDAAVRAYDEAGAALLAALYEVAVEHQRRKR